MDLLYHIGETFERNGHQVLITRDVPWSGWPRWGDILVDGAALKSGDSGSRVSWQGKELITRSKLRRRPA